MTATAVSVDELRKTRAVPLSRIFRVELRKMVDTRAGLWLFVAIGVLTAAAVVLFLIFAPPEELHFANFAGIALTPQGFLLPVLGILLITSEWAQRTGLVTFTQEPNRGRVVVAKTLSALLVGVAAAALLLTVAGVGNVLGVALQDGAGGWDASGGRGFLYVLILQVSGIIQGLAFGMLLMNSAAAIVSCFAIPISFSIVFGTVPALEGVAPWIDLGTAQEPLLEFDKAVSGMEWAQLAATTAIWVGLLFTLGVVRLLRSEVRSA